MDTAHASIFAVSSIEKSGILAKTLMITELSGRSSVVEFQPSKLAVTGSNPVARSKQRQGKFVVEQR